MPIYVFKCRNCGSTFEQYRRMADFSRQAICDCRGLSDLVVNNTVNISIFNPYVENNMAPEPIRIESKRQRDALCEKYGVTYDSSKYVRPSKYVAATDTITEKETETIIQNAKALDAQT